MSYGTQTYAYMYILKIKKGLITVRAVS